MYNNFNVGYGGGYSPVPYAYQRPKRGYYKGAQSWGVQRPQGKKRSGAKYIHTSKNGNPCITAWNASKSRGLLSILVAPYKGTKVVHSKSGREWHVWMASVIFKKTGQKSLSPVLVDAAKHSCTIKELGLTINPGAPNGGYCGTFVKRNNRY